MERTIQQNGCVEWIGNQQLPILPLTRQAEAVNKGPVAKTNALLL